MLPGAEQPLKPRVSPCYKLFSVLSNHASVLSLGKGECSGAFAEEKRVSEKLKSTWTILPGTLSIEVNTE